MKKKLLIPILFISGLFFLLFLEPVSLAAPWFQGTVGNIYSAGDLNAGVPLGNYVSAVDINVGDSGLVTYTGLAANIGDGSESDAEWDFQESYAGTIDLYNYDYFKAKISDQTPFLDSTLSNSNRPGVDGAYFHNGDLTISSPQFTLPSNRNLVFLVDGNLSIDGRVETNSSSFLAFIVSGDININSALGGSFANPDVQSVLIANGQIHTGNSPTQLFLQGIFVARGGFDLQRTYDGGNAAENFLYAPSFFVNAPTYIRESETTWREIKP